MTTPGVDPQRPERVMISVPRWVASLRDPGMQSTLVLVGLALAGFAMMSFGWRGGARTPYVPLQLPWFVSGAMAGIGVLGMALGAWSIHLGRRMDATHRAAVEDLVHDVAGLAEDLRTGRKTFPGR